MDPAPHDRMLSVDALRGATVAGMIVVNSPGSWSDVYPWLTHADWHGWTFADLVFPSFLFIVGVAIPFAFSRRARLGQSPSAIYARVVRRVAILFALGLVLNSFPYWSPSTLRIPGVLQRIALCYAVAVPLVLRTRPRTQAWTAAALLAVYAALLLFVPVPGHGAGALDSKEGNLAAFVDRALLSGHLYRESWDPEGVLSTLPAVATTLLGVLAGHWLRSPRDARAKSAALLAAGAIAIAAGQLWGRWLPINKSLWTPSYVLFTGGISLAILAACHFAIDVRGHRAVARVLAVLGANAIVCYVGSELLEQLLETTPIRLADGTYTAPKLWLWTHFFSLWPSAPAASLAYALLQVALWLAVAAELQRRRIFVRI